MRVKPIKIVRQPVHTGPVKPLRLTFVQPAIGHRRGENYIKTWQMEPLSIATLAGLTPADVQLQFFDDRMERVDYDAPTDVVAITVETYTAKRAYQIASGYRRRGVPVIMGGFHATLMTAEVARYAEAVIVGEAEAVWAQVLDDARHGTLQPQYRSTQAHLGEVRVDRRVFAGKRYLPVGLIETGRGCKFPCEFCAVQTFFERSYRHRPVEQVVAEVDELAGSRKFLFFVNDNFAGDMKGGTALLEALRDKPIRWVTQISINAAHDEAYVAALARAGCKGVLIGFESLNEDNLKAMNKRFNSMKSGFSGALANLRRHGIAVYGTFMFGYEHDTPDSFAEAVQFAIDERMYITAFNHLTPFPGTPLYTRLQQEGRLVFDAWWLDERYRYNDLPYRPTGMTAQAVTQGCLGARRDFYSWRSIFKRHWGNRSDAFMWRNFWLINAMHRDDIAGRNGFPLGDEQVTSPLLAVA